MSLFIVMDEQLQKLILAQLQELTKISNENSRKLERLETLHEASQETRKNKDAVLMANVRQIEEDLSKLEQRLEKLEKFQTKLVVLASAVAFMIAILWEVISKFIVPFVS